MLALNLLQVVIPLLCINTSARSLPFKTTKELCPHNHVSDCRYIVMMHSFDEDDDVKSRESASDVVTIASTEKHAEANLKDDMNTTPTQDPAWFKIVSDRHPSTGDKPNLSHTSVGNLVWYSTTMHPTTAALIEGQREIHQVKYLIPDLPVRLYGNVQRHPPSWGLDRIDQRSNTLDGLYHYPSSAGENVTIYVVDTGVNVDHKDFEGRAEHGPVFVAGTDDNSDLNGHGTSVAALAAGSAYGVAKKARIVSLKTLDDTGAGRLSNVLAAIEWVVKRHLSQGRNTRSVINLSLGAEHNEPTNAAIQEAMRLGIHFSIAAGNDGKNACRFSPASTPGVMTVGATDRDDTVASYSNWGPCVAIYAPGSDITSAWIGSKTATHVQSGTSMASPHVAGLIALLLSESPDESFPTGAMVDTILRTVTKVSMDYATVAGMPLPLPLSDQPEDSVWSKHQSPPEPYGNGLARSLVYVGASTSRRGNETEIEDPPATSSTSASASLMTDAMRGILLAVVCSLIIGT